jgi:pimeloyl-ACP methyl ester carboxylesterase
VIVLTCGGDADATFWNGVVAELAPRFRVLVWDPAGVGRSDPPYDSCYTIERFGGDLDAVLALAEGRPALLVGHGAGALATLALCEKKPALLCRQIAGLALIDTPLPPEAGRLAALYDALLGVDMWFSPVVGLMNWASYFNGSAHLLVRAFAFGVRPARAELDLVARMYARQSPEVRAKGLQAARDWRRTPGAIAVRAPVLVLSSGNAGAAGPEAIEAVRHATPAPDVEVLEIGGALGPVEAPEACAAAIARHADRVFACVDARRQAREAERLRARSPVWSVAAEPASWEREESDDRPAAEAAPLGRIASYTIGHA